ncbi:hypothetical protein NUW58_g5157 [Xylaria curta]|uniref:Uncharacterized protein n=1 Tax=Xylaria curta TaxID=42375 RepID=A0ACC1P2Z6_9PEZI|nr:hypothetical protein NUW58_g5157 [Xylaria curta]
MRKEEEKKRLALEQEAAQIEKQEQVDSAARILLGWAQSIQDEVDMLKSNYGGWSVKDADIDAVRRLYHDGYDQGSRRLWDGQAREFTHATTLGFRTRQAIFCTQSFTAIHIPLHPHRVGFTESSPMPGMTATPLSPPPSPVTKMKVLPQRPGPGGSRVMKKRPSIPHLGDGLLTVFTPTAALATSAAHVGTEASGTLTSSNLNQLAKSTTPGDDFVLNGTLSICSEDDVILIGTPSQSLCFESSSPVSGPGITWAVSTPRTTLTSDDSFSSDGETALGSASPTPINIKTFPSPRSTPSLTNEIQDITTRTNLQSPNAFSFFKSNGTTCSPRPTMRHPADRLSEWFNSAPVTSFEAVPANEKIPDVDSLHGIVRGFLATDAKAIYTSPSMREPQTPPSVTTACNKPRPFWDPHRIFDFYIRGAITPEKAKETARRYDYPDVIPVIDETEAMRKKNPFLLVSDFPTKTPKEGDLDVLDVFDRSTELSASTPRQDHYDARYHNFMLKLATYSAADSSVGLAKPLHVFVDMSNIHIGFCNSWKISQNIPIDRRIRAPAFNFRVLASIMERSRTAKKKVLASSVASHVISRTQWPQHFVDAENQGYKTSILSRVQKLSPIKTGRRRKASLQGPSVVYPTNMVTSSDESAEDITKAGYETRNGEQGVDEILHLNMMNSILDNMQEPGSMILATGDAAQAEFSEGFLEYATRALSLGWNLELVTWKTTISSAWTNPAFLSKYEAHFRIIYLDDFLEELNADLCPSLA